MMEATHENEQKHAVQGGRIAVEIASEGRVNSHPSLRSWTTSETPGYQNWRQEGWRRTSIKDKQELSTVSKPAKELTLFALRLAILEKSASKIGTLTFIWATVVILGGQVNLLKEQDFWFVTVILVTEGARIFCRSHELEWQHLDPGTSTLHRVYLKGSDALHRSSCTVRDVLSWMTQRRGRRLAQRESHRSAVEVLPRILERTSWVSSTPIGSHFRAKLASALLYLLELMSAGLSIVLSVMRLISRNFVQAFETDTGPNHASALLLFYGLTVLEAFIFLFERTYWHYQLAIKDIMGNAVKRSHLPLNEESLYVLRRFFYNVYSECLNDSIFAGLKMDMFDYTLSWLQSDKPSEQLASVRALLSFSSDGSFSEEALRRIANHQAAVERLIEILTRRSTLKEIEIQTAAAELLCNLVRFNRNSIRVASIPGSLDAVVSLLCEDNLERARLEAESTYYTHGSVQNAKLQQPKNLSAYALGLRILINLAKNPQNCIKIGETRGLLTELFKLIEADNPALPKYDATTETLKDSILYLSLRLIGLLVSAAGTPGKSLREEIVKVAGSISSLKRVLNLTHGRDALVLHQRAAETLFSLALDEKTSEAIGRTGGVIESLFELFRCYKADGDQRNLKVALKAGQALKMLVLKEGKNCDRICQLAPIHRQNGSRTGAVEELLKMVDDRGRSHIAMDILSSVCKFASDDYPDCKARIAARILQVLELGVDEEQNERQVAAIGLAARIVPLLTKDERDLIFSPSQKLATRVVKRLHTILNQNCKPSTQFPSLRRSCLELILALLNADSAFFRPKFVDHQFRPLLLQLTDTTSDVDNYCTFRNDVGITLHTVLIEQLLDDAIAKLHIHQHK